MLPTALGASCMNPASVSEWHKRFKEGRESVREAERCGRSRDVRKPELIGQKKNFMDRERRVSIETISAKFDVSVGTVHAIIPRNWRCGRFARSLSQGCSEKIRKKDVVMTAGSGRADQFRSRSSWCSGDVQWKRDLQLWPETTSQSSQWKHAGSPRPKKARYSKSTHKLLTIPFSTGLAWSTCTGFPLNRQSTRNTMLRF